MLASDFPSNEVAFFEIAATLIPLLLFGGVLVERAQPPALGQWKSDHAILAVVVTVFGALALLAEALAIETVVTGVGSTVKRILVSFVLVGAMTSVVFAIASPWITRLEKSGRDNYKSIADFSILTVILAAIAACLLLLYGTDFAAQGGRIEKYQAAFADNLTEQKAARQHLDSLRLEASRLTGRLSTASGHGDRIAVMALTAEMNSLNVLIESTASQESRLFREAVNLERKARGEGPLEQKRND